MRVRTEDKESIIQQVPQMEKQDQHPSAQKYGETAYQGQPRAYEQGYAGQPYYGEYSPEY